VHIYIINKFIYNLKKVVNLIIIKVKVQQVKIFAVIFCFLIFRLDFCF